MKYIIDISERHKYAVEMGITQNGSIASKVILNAVKNGVPYEPRPHGEWQQVGEMTYRCTNCGWLKNLGLMPYCENCGSDNRKKEDKSHGS